MDPNNEAMLAMKGLRSKQCNQLRIPLIWPTLLLNSPQRLVLCRH